MKMVIAKLPFLLLICIVNCVTAKYVIRLRSDSQCPTPGYFRDESDCRKFYRCAEHPTTVDGQIYISRSEYSCPPGTIFDEAISSCNHIMFVQNIPPGCDVNGGVSGVPEGGSGAGSASSDSISDSSSSPSQASSVMQSSGSTTPKPVTTTSPSSSQPPHLPMFPPEMQMIPMFPGGGDQQQQPMLPSINLPIIPGGDQQQQPMLPSINLPMKPEGGQQQPMFPSINLPMMPGGDQQQQPMFPSINFPMIPGDQGQQPMFPFPMLPGSQGQQPMIPGIPSVPAGGHQHQSLLSSLSNLQTIDRDQKKQQTLAPTSASSFKFPSNSGSPQLPQLTLPSSLNFLLPSPNGQFQLNNNQNNKQNVYPSEQNLQNLGGTSSAITITAQNNGQSENKPGQASGIGGWITPQQFPEQTVVKPAGDSNGGWVVPDNFPTFYSAFTGGSPIFLSAHASNPSSIIFI